MGKRSISFLLFFCLIVTILLLPSCKKQSQQDLGDQYVFGQDMQYMYWNGGTSDFTMTESPDGYYFMEGNTIFYMDKSSMEVVPLCNKPDCLHHLETDPKKVWKCNAYVPTGLESYLFWWNGNLYTVVMFDQNGNQLEHGSLLKISPDGAQREYLCELTADPHWAIVHRGKFYYASSVFDESLEPDYQVKAIDLNNPKQQEETIFHDHKDGGSIQRLLAYGNHLYINVDYYDNGKSTTESHEINILTKEDTIIDSDLKDGKRQMVFGTFLDQKMYVYLMDSTEDGEKTSEEQRTIWSMDLDGNNRQKAFVMGNEDTYTYVYADQKNLYLFAWWPFVYTPEDRFLSMIDQEGNELAKVDLSEIEGSRVTFSPGGENYLFLNSMENNETFYRYAVNKQELLKNGTAKPEKVSEVTIAYTYADYS